MSVLVDSGTKLVVSGLTGREGSFHGMNNRRYGTDLVAGVTPGKGGHDVEGVPVFDTVHEAVAETGANTSMIFVPPRFAADAILEAADAHALSLERLGLRLSRPLRARHDRAGVAHRLPRRRREAGDVGEHRLVHLLGDVIGRALLLLAADLAAHHDELGLGIGLEEIDDLDERGALDRVAADADDRRVAEPALGQLVADLVGERARAGHEPDVALREEVRRDDPDIRLAG